MRTRNIITGFFLLGFSFTGFAQTNDNKTYSLKQCVETAVANNLDARLAGLSVQTNEANWKQSKMEMLPTLNASVGHGINQGRSIDPYTNQYINKQIKVADYGASSELVLFNGLSLQNNIKRNSLDYEASKMYWQQTKDGITISVILKYLDVMTDEELLVQGQKQLDLTAKQVERLTTLNDNGSIKPSDLSDMKGHLADDQIAMIDKQNALESDKLALCKLMNIIYDKSMKLEKIDAGNVGEIYPDLPSDIYKKALTELAQIRYRELKTKSAQKAVKVAQGQLFPRLTLNGNAGSNYSSAASQSVFLNTATISTGDYIVLAGTPTPVLRDQDNFRSDKIAYTKQLNNNISTYISLNLSIPIFNAFRQRTRVKLAKIDAKGLLMTEQTAKTQLQQDVEQGYLDMASVYEKYKTLLVQVSSYQESFNAAEIRYNEGVGNSIDYLTARNNFDRASNNLIIAKYDYIVRTKILDYYQGKLTW
ncbi:MAG: TolC family protein [Chitinophagaceae bacterium]